ncbi:flavin monoamine oxidase family protein [Tabrizicola sp.]|uniref:flavin monoamine oxidase family protein n=1 Tax=Tabrizicola sp. TaxID=2005166 RepID=UPI003F3BA7A5
MIQRREALALLPGALLAPRFGHAQTGRSVVVIGAGMAGLAAARDLQSAGAKVTVVEARNRIGGRIHTSRLWPGLPVDLGASWIHGTDGNPLTALADEVGARRVDTRYERGFSLRPDGSKVDLTSAMDDAGKLVADARTAAERLPSDVSLAEAIQSSPAWQDGDALTRRMIRHYVNATVELEYAGDWSEISAWNFDQGDFFPGPDVLFPDGYDAIPTRLSQGLTLRMGQVVTALAPTPTGVAVTLADGSTLTTDHAVVTLPLGVLKSGRVAFGEPLAPARVTAIDTLGMGLFNKCWLRFDSTAWDAKVDWIEWLSPRDGFWSQWVSLARATGAPALVAFHGGAQARELEALDDNATLSAASEALRAMFGTDFPAPVAAQVTRWSQDPFALGSYSFITTGTSPDTRRALAGADWDGRLVFAGEATEPDHASTAHGACLSGQTAARTILESTG